MAVPRAYRGKLTPEEYLREERSSSLKREYLHGEVFAFAGTSPAHEAERRGDFPACYRT